MIKRMAGRSLRKVFPYVAGGGFLLLISAMFVQSLPDLIRYMKIRSM